MTTANGSTPHRETMLCKPVVAAYESGGWDVHQEITVELRAGTRFHADMIAVKDETIVALEAKISLDSNLIRQLIRWRPLAHQVIGIVSHPGHYAKGTHIQLLGELRKHCIGLVYVTKDARLERKITPVRNTNPDIGPVSRALSMPHRPQEAGRPSPLGRASGRTWERYRPVREYLQQYGPTPAKLMPIDKHVKNEMHRLATRGELHQQTGIMIQDPHATPWVYECIPEESAGA